MKFKKKLSKVQASSPGKGPCVQAKALKSIHRSPGVVVTDISAAIARIHMPEEMRMEEPALVERSSFSCPFPIQFLPVSVDHLCTYIEAQLKELGAEIGRLRWIAPAPQLVLHLEIEAFVRAAMEAIMLFARQHPVADAIYCCVEPSYLDYRLPQEVDLASELPALHFTLSTAPYRQGHSTYTPADFPRLAYLLKLYPGITETLYVVDAHHGFASIESGKHCYIIPRGLNTIQATLELFTGERLSSYSSLDAHEDQVFLTHIRNRTSWSSARIALALKVSKHYHRHEYRKSGEPFYHHPLAVATLLLDHTDQEDVIIAALLHDITQDVPGALVQISAWFGDKVAQLLYEVKELYDETTWTQNPVDLQERGCLPKHDALLIQLADRQHNLTSLNAHPCAGKRKKIAQSTLDVFVPAAELLGKQEMQEVLRFLSEEMLEREAQGEV